MNVLQTAYLFNFPTVQNLLTKSLGQNSVNTFTMKTEVEKTCIG